VQYEIFGEITPETLAGFDADQNISDLKENNNSISKVYKLMGWFYGHPGARSQTAKDKKKGAQRAPLTPTESLEATACSHHHKTRLQYGYLSPAIL
jgi:hypothetical protein